MIEGSCLRGGVRFAIDGGLGLVPAGSLDGQPELTPFRHIFVSLNPPWYEIRDDLPQFAQHVPPEQRLPTK